MIRPPARSVPFLRAAAALALAAPVAAQETIDLPPSSPAPAPAGQTDEREGLAIPPRDQPIAVPQPTATPVIQPLPSPSASLPSAAPRPRGERIPQASASAPSAAAADPAGLAAVPQAPGEPSASPSGQAPPLASAPGDAGEAAGTGAAPVPLPDWWPYAAGGLGALALVGGGALLWRRRKPKVLRLAAPTGAAARPAATAEPPRLDLTLDITAATRSVMMFTLEYRLTIANRSDRAVGDCNAAVQLACARAAAGGAPSAGAAQGMERIARIGPQQARSISGRVQLPLSAITPLRQGQTPLFIPLVHVTLEGEGLPAHTRTFVIGMPSQSGRVHPISLDQPPGGIAGLVAQGVTVPAANAAA